MTNCRERKTEDGAQGTEKVNGRKNSSESFLSSVNKNLKSSHSLMNIFSIIFVQAIWSDIIMGRWYLETICWET